MTERNMTCVACPLGCQLTVTLDGDNVISVTGNTCKRGDAYARTEIFCPTRSLTTTVKCEGGIHPVVPVKSSVPVPKDKLLECMKVINSVTVQAPVMVGQVIIHNILGTDAHIVATNNN
ncbi:MAG: DUF1667 domain-containing protein [Clostridia bacterium]|nr:DUF1667 domain-containing protein [Clostridia bacterium]MBR3955196.1 DUF1667 domain-containing protein [Clostridia bacterium]